MSFLCPFENISTSQMQLLFKVWVRKKLPDNLVNFGSQLWRCLAIFELKSSK